MTVALAKRAATTAADDTDTVEAPEETDERNPVETTDDMPQVTYSAPAEMELDHLTQQERSAVDAATRRLATEPRIGRAVPDQIDGTHAHALDLAAQRTGGRPVTLLYRYDSVTHEVLITWLLIGP